MKQTFLLTSILALSASFFISDVTFGANSDIIINEIGGFPMSTKWIEIWNKGSEPVDLIKVKGRGWKLWDPTVVNGHNLTVSTTDSIVAAGEYAVIVQDATQFLMNYPNFTGSIFDSSFDLKKKDGGVVGLKDDDGNFTETTTYPGGLTYSWERKDPFLTDYTSANWQEHASGDTLGFQNSNYGITAETAPTTTGTPPADTTTASHSLPTIPSTSSLWAQIKINEFLPNPDGGDEWIELYNSATTSLDLIDGLLCDNRETSCTIATTSGTIAAEGWATFFLNGSHLNNSGDSVILKNPDGLMVDQVTYGTDALKTPGKNQTIARKNDGVDTDSEADWAITTSLTPGTGNTIVAPPAPAPPTNNGGGGGSSSGGSAGTTPATPSALSIPTSQKNTTSTAKIPAKGLPASRQGAGGDQVKIIWKISAPRTAAPQEIAELNAAGSADPRGGAIFTSWNLGDGTTIDGQSVQHSFAASGTYRVVVSATSTQGTTGQQTFLITVAAGLSTRHGEVLISEIFPNPPGADQGEFIELFNSASASISLAGWKLETNNGKGFTIPEKTSINPGGYLVFYRAATRLVLDNTKESVTLKTPDDVVADRVTYNQSEPNQSLSLRNDEHGWTTEITPGFLGVSAGQVLGEKITVSKVTPALPTVARPTRTPVHLALAEARSLKKGSAVSVQGVVTVPPGAFSEHYFYIADDSGGLQIYSSKKDLPPVAAGDKINIAGQLSQANGIPRLKIASVRAVDILATKQTLEPEKLTLEAIDDGVAGKLVAVNGEITDIKGNQLYLDDGETEGVVYLKTAAHIDKSRLKSGDNLQVIGIVEQTKNGWQIWPRANNDIQLITNSASSQTSNPNNGPTTKYVITTVGGLSLLAAAFILQKKLVQK
ncbi:MAG: lamin tail domain-containing protein [Candidatus Magasanikbacteria bacterium]|nr:lamin tail domain-containing protein [Candidatus Magasanikbacteria bacterium]